ncbi:MAG TPA: HEAT repeat domain-containing protein [Anaerolineaceae bacterium]
MEDANPTIKELAIRLLWENPSFDLMQKFLNLVSAKEETLAATAASALGNYVYLGEVEELPQSKYEMVIEGLFDIYNSTAPKLVRRRALESLGFANLDEVKEAIQVAYESGDKEWVISALYAMGRSLDDIWNPAILLNLKNKDSEIRFEAIRAAGEMELNAARPDLMMLLKDRELDKEIRFITIWALSRIGGEGVRELLELLSRQVEDDEEAEILDDALEYMDFCEGVSLGELFSIDQDNLNEITGDQIVEDLLDNLDQENLNKSSEEENSEETRHQRKRHKKHGD